MKQLLAIFLLTLPACTQTQDVAVAETLVTIDTPCILNTATATEAPLVVCAFTVDTATK